jgi:Asp-tRNA(Asn)/Glu-tRNA(Gln) amidotransferase B subunit
MLDEMRNIVAVLVGKALEGDTNAASLVLSRVLPSLKAQAEKVQFDFDATATISEQVAQVLDAIAAGAIAPDVGRVIIESVKALSDVRAAELLEARIAALEERTA